MPCVRVLQGMRWEEGWSGELLQGRAHGAERKAERRVEIDLSQLGIPKREICPGPSPLKVRDEKIQGQEKCVAHRSTVACRAARDCTCLFKYLTLSAPAAGNLQPKSRSEISLNPGT